ncbi:cytotoxic translational repressor of toxin-antitoxin stability system [Salinibacterium sp. SYSU T00001]|uniref:cytotoxic translational repressor of toxin-antitoxin stability system n=1 Tax=Homoserinimonas sedimenticola TaxID=2986805 RepID=UPI0022361F85|nr:cytotoxic translational repressor of toxin-antitoxin stability system [Salinibacterium sedimenticola]MCW4386307.1 cytotoxic translational repressor of toxin-antitoxin stability system [Salinibacterium sedimenticola]
MSKHPAATRADHRKFCSVEGWQVVRDAVGREARHHVTLELETSDGRVLRTRISRPVGPDTYGASLWRHILRDQLDVTADEFWRCVNDGIVPERSADSTPVPVKPLPLSLVKALLAAGVSPAELEGLTAAEAKALLKGK